MALGLCPLDYTCCLRVLAEANVFLDIRVVTCIGCMRTERRVDFYSIVALLKTVQE